MHERSGILSPKPPAEELLSRLELGLRKYNHGVRVNDDTRTWGTRTNSWMEMAREEFLDGIIYVAADYIRIGRNGKEHKSLLEIEFNDYYRKDDNRLIMYILDNYTRIDSPKHKKMISTLCSCL
jgi:hypothetical protein